MAVCLICNGSGYTLNDGLCDDCNGTGESIFDYDVIISKDGLEYIHLGEQFDPDTNFRLKHNHQRA